MYALYLKEEKEMYLCTDRPAITRVIGISANTIKNWFLNGKEHKETDKFIIKKNPIEIKSKRLSNGKHRKH